MAGVRPLFFTGANAKIKVNGKTLAYCTNLSYSVQIKHATPTLLGMYEPSSVEPTGYLVTGQFSVIRYIADAIGEIGGQRPNGTTDSGNGIGNWNSTGGPVLGGRAEENLVPKRLHHATGFNIEVIQKTAGKHVTAAKIRDARITKADFSLSKKAPATQTFNFTALYVDEDSFLADFSGIGQHLA